MGLQFTKPHEAVGIEATGIDLKTVTDGEFEAIQEQFFENGVIFFREQEMEPKDHIAFAERWAEIEVNRFFSPVKDHPQIAEVLKEADQTVNIGGGWHTDHSYDQVPAMGSILRAIELPSEGGDTRFMSTATAYDRLDDETKEEISELYAIHSSRHIFGEDADIAKETGDRFGNAKNATQDSRHPVVITHPNSGKKCIYVNAGFTTHIEGLEKEASDELLNKLYAHCAQEQLCYQFKWEPGSIAFWDNRSTWHWALNDYHGKRRYMHRITLKGVPLN